MMEGKNRMVNTKIWDDKWIQQLPVNQKLLFIYFLTNASTNVTGIYEITLRKISFDTGLSESEISEILKVFDTKNKIVYDHEEGYLILLNFLKHQKLNTNMKKSAINIINELPESIRLILQNRYNKYEIFLRSLKPIKVDKQTGISFSKFWKKYDKKVGDIEEIKVLWYDLTFEEKESAYIYIEKYFEASPEKQFRKNPKNYLLSKTWNDEIITKPIKTTESNKNSYNNSLNDLCEVVNV